jgi:hypothetical protein
MVVVSTAARIGQESAQPFVISIFRFLIVGIIMVKHHEMKNLLHSKKEWIE